MADLESTAEPKHKRKSGKRTARACDECRLRKSKCDGLQPCEACQSTDRYCTYNLPASRSTGSGTRIRILEDRLRRARAYLNEAQKRTPSLANVNFDALLGPIEEYSPQQSQPTRSSSDQDLHQGDDSDTLESMMDSYGQMNLDTNGTMERDFYGAASGLAWIQQTRHYFDDLDLEYRHRYADATDVGNSAAVQLFDAPLPPRKAFDVATSIPQLLPPRETASRLLHVVVTQVYPMFHFLSEDDFEVSTNRIYERFLIDYQERDQSFLPLFYLVMSLGHLFSRDEHRRHGCRASVSEAMRYFVAARNMVDIAYLRTIVSLQAMISLILYLVSTARIASAHAFLGAACAAAMRQGLHFRSTHDADLPHDEKKVRRRVFWAIVNLDLYITSILGLPPFMDMSTVDPAIDLTIELALKEAKTSPSLSPADGVALAASARHIELRRIVFKAQQTLFPKPIDPPDAASRNGTIFVSVPKVQEVEYQLNEWAQSLRDILLHPDTSIGTQRQVSPCPPLWTDVDEGSVKYEVQICYHFAQILIYRAFLHYLAKQHEAASINQCQLSYAQNCVGTAKKVVELSIEHQRKGLLCPASWPAVYTVFISVVCLVFAYATRPHDADDGEIKRDIENGIRLLGCTACSTDTGSVRCLEILRRLIKRVSYAVDVDLDTICAETSPCCATEFSHKGQPDRSFGADGSPCGKRSASGTLDNVSDAPTVPSMVSGGHEWPLAPDVTMTQPSFSEIVYGPRPTDAQHPQEDQEQSMEIPYGGTFDWQDANHGLTAITDRRPPQQEGGASAIKNERLTAEDIAAFMHPNPMDDPFLRRSR